MRQPLSLLILGLFVCLSMSSFAWQRSDEFGKAGYYADALQGRKTASGEKYDKKLLTCAHKSYPFGTKLRITRLDNKKAVIVRVNDRGPFTEGFVVDLSRAAAEEIDLVKAGRANVKIELIEPEKIVTAAASVSRTATTTASTGNGQEAAATSKKTQIIKPKQKAATAAKPVTYSTEDPTPATTQKGETGKDATDSDLYKVDLRTLAKAGFGVQVITLYDADNVMPMVSKLQTQYPGKVLVSRQRDEASNVSTYRIVIGPYPTRKGAENQQKVAERKVNKKCFVVDLSTI